MELKFEHTVYYSTKEPVPIKDIVSSLSALERIYKRTPYILTALYPNYRIYNCDVLLDELQSNSLLEKFLIKIFFEDEEQLDALLDDFRQKFGIKEAIKRRPLFSLITTIILYQGGLSAIQRFTPETEKGEKIEVNIENLYMYGAKEFQIDPENLRRAIENNIIDKNQLPYDVMNVLKQARNDNTSEVIIDKQKVFTINRESIDSIPDNSDEVEIKREYKDVKVLIRATDLDSHRRGWGVIIPEISEKRVKLELDPMIDPNFLFQNKKIKGDVLTIYKVNDDGELVPKLYYLDKINNNKSE